MPHKKKDITGMIFGKLTAIEPVGRTKQGGVIWRCLCSCGNECNVTLGSLTSGNTKGCQKCKNQTHGHSKSRLYRIYTNMKRRCYNPHFNHYEQYGGRGIKVCDEWVHDYIAFEKWAIDNGYSDNLTIDRIDVNGNYSPNNCRWATRKQQGLNRRTNVIVEINGVSKTLKEWSESSGICYKTIQFRYYKGIRGADLIAPVKRRGRK